MHKIHYVKTLKRKRKKRNVKKKSEKMVHKLEFKTRIK